MDSRAYGDLIRLPAGGADSLETLARVPLGAGAADGGIDESSLRDLLFRYPQTLPISAIDGDYGDPIPVCTELSTDAGYVDALYVNARGRLILTEFKLWRNPKARREVIGQILDYAKEFASWSYEDLQRQVSRALGKSGNVLYELVQERHSDIDEAHFVDAVTRRLTRGEFLLLIVGDGIREGVRNIVDFVQSHSGLRFNLAMVEAALYRDGAERLIVQPRVLARTEIVQRTVFERAERPEPAVPDPPTLREKEKSEKSEMENRRFWTAVTHRYAFSDVSVEPPETSSNQKTLDVKVRNSGFNDWGLCFTGYVHREEAEIGCYLTRRKNIVHACRVYDDLIASIDDLRTELGGELIDWTDSRGRPRLGFMRKMDDLAFLDLESDADSDAFKEAVTWMREHLDRLVSVLNPRIQRMISDP